MQISKNVNNDVSMNPPLGNSHENRLCWLHMCHRTVNLEVNFYFRQKCKTAISPPIFSLFKKIFQKLEILPRPLFWPKNPNLKKIADPKVYCNLNWVYKIINSGIRKQYPQSFGWVGWNIQKYNSVTNINIDSLVRDKDGDKRI